MKKCLALAVLASAASVASAQSTLTLYGIADVSLRTVHGEGNGHANLVASGGNATSRLGLRGTEDLGGGFDASFWLESAFFADNGSFNTTNTNNQVTGTSRGGGMTFRQRSTVSLSGGFGELRIGRDLTPSYRNMLAVDPFGSVGVGSNLPLIGAIAAANNLPTQTRASNSATYFLSSNLGGVYGQLTYAVGENPSNAPNPHDGNYSGGRLGFNGGPIDVALSTGTTKLLSLGDYVQTNLYGAYDFGVAKILSGLFQERLRNAAGAKATSWVLGALVPVGRGDFRVAYTSVNQNAGAGNNDARQMSFGYVYHLSKRSALYTTCSLIDNKSGKLYNNGMATAVNGGRTSGVEAGLRHSF
jgi:predicted porin